MYSIGVTARLNMSYLSESVSAYIQHLHLCHISFINCDVLFIVMFTSGQKPIICIHEAVNLFVNLFVNLHSNFFAMFGSFKLFKTLVNSTI